MELKITGINVEYIISVNDPIVDTLVDDPQNTDPKKISKITISLNILLDMTVLKI